MSAVGKLITLVLLMILEGCLPIAPSESGGFMGDTLMRVCVYTKRTCDIQIISQPGHRILLEQRITQTTILRELNPAINLAKEVQVFADCGEGLVMAARSSMPDPFTSQMCLLVELF
jgi:hypothetical protein